MLVGEEVGNFEESFSPDLLDEFCELGGILCSVLSGVWIDDVNEGGSLVCEELVEGFEVFMHFRDGKHHLYI